MDEEIRRDSSKMIVDDTLNHRISVDSRGKRSAGRGRTKKEDNTLNFMSGDMTFHELRSISGELGLSPMAMRAKENADSNISIFQKRSSAAPLVGGNESIAYWNIEPLSKFISSSGAIVSSRISGLKSEQQLLLKSAVKVARFLALLPYVEY